MPPEIADITRYLDEYAPSALEFLRRRHPESTALLRPKGLVLGGVDSAVRRDVAVTMLTTVTDTADEAMAQVSRKLRSARLLELVGSILALLASGGVVGATVGLNSVWIGAIFGIIGFLASGVPMVVAWLRATDIGANTIAENFVRLRELAWDARALHAEFTRNSAHDAALDEALISKVNMTGRELAAILSNLGYRPGIRPI